MEIIRGRSASFMEGAALAECLRGYSKVHIDLGTGDGRFAQYAANHTPTTFVIGIDACRATLVEVSRQHFKNALFVIANAESLPSELNTLASSLTINFPWGSLLEGLLKPNSAVLEGLIKVTAPNARIEVRLNGGALSEVGWTLESGATQIRRALLGAGFALKPLQMLIASELKACPTTWAKRLAFGRDPRGMYLCGAKNL